MSAAGGGLGSHRPLFGRATWLDSALEIGGDFFPSEVLSKGANGPIWTQLVRNLTGTGEPSPALPCRGAPGDGVHFAGSFSMRLLSQSPSLAPGLSGAGPGWAGLTDSRFIML